MRSGISAAGTPSASSSPARRLRDCGASAVATRSPVPARPISDSGRAPRRLGEAPDLGEDVAGGGARGVEALALGRAGGQRGRVLGGARELDADRVVGGLADDAGLLEERGERQRERLVGGGRDEAGALVDHLARVRRARRRSATRWAPKSAVSSTVGGVPRGRHEALGQRDDRGARGQARGGQSGDDGVQPARGNGEQDVVRTRQPRADGLDLQRRRQLDARQVDLVLAVGVEALGLDRGARLQRRPHAAAGQQDRDRRAERARADDDGAPSAGRGQRERRPRAVGHAASLNGRPAQVAHRLRPPQCRSVRPMTLAMERAVAGLERARRCRWADVGRSAHPDAAIAGREAARSALAGARRCAPPRRLRLRRLRPCARLPRRSPRSRRGVPVVGCSSAGEIDALGRGNRQRRRARARRRRLQRLGGRGVGLGRPARRRRARRGLHRRRRRPRAPRPAAAHRRHVGAPAPDRPRRLLGRRRGRAARRRHGRPARATASAPSLIFDGAVLAGRRHRRRDRLRRAVRRRRPPRLAPGRRAHARHARRARPRAGARRPPGGRGLPRAARRQAARRGHARPSARHAPPRRRGPRALGRRRRRAGRLAELLGARRRAGLADGERRRRRSRRRPTPPAARRSTASAASPRPRSWSWTATPACSSSATA